MNRRRQDAGFTLIELLVVIAIIAILAAILFPVLLSARERAKTAGCMAYCRQAGIALQGYMGDNDDTVPTYSHNPDGTDTGLALWWDQLQPYMKSKALWYCPSSQPANSTNATHDTRRWIVVSQGDGKVYEGSYCFNGWLYCDRWAAQSVWKIPMKMSQIPRPSRTMAFSDGIWIDTWVSNYEAQPAAAGSHLERIYINRHNDGINAVFMDGHARWLAKRQLTNTDPNKRSVLYNPRTGD